jgi:pyruvate/2-oxoglutarate/acetoin dehydrogenase E1 component
VRICNQYANELRPAQLQFHAVSDVVLVERIKHACRYCKNTSANTALTCELLLLLLPQHHLQAFDYLDAPIERVTGADVPMPYATDLERSALPQIDNIIAAVKRVVYREK